MNKTAAQALIRKASPGFLANNPPVGIAANLAEIQRRLTLPEFRKPFARIPDENDQQQPDCHECNGFGDYYVCQEQRVVECCLCGGECVLPFKDNNVFVTVYRNGRSVETLAEVYSNGEVAAWVTVAEPGFQKGEHIPLTDEEKALARGAVNSNN